MFDKPMRKVLVTGAAGQIGTELVGFLRQRFSEEQVIAGGYQTPADHPLRHSGPLVEVDVTDPEQLRSVIREHQIDTIFHLAAILSAVGEDHPQLAWQVNAGGTINVLEAAREHELSRVIIPSSIAVYGRSTPIHETPQETILWPRTMYGVTKVAGELLADYYVNKFEVDVRGVRFPGIISSEALPGGGTTDYAVDIFYQAILHRRYTCFVREDTVLPMMYMPDALAALFRLAKAEHKRLRYYNAYNVTAMSFSVGDLVEEIRKHIPEFECIYEPDFRQNIAESWPRTIDDSAARRDWFWKPRFDLAAMTEDMIRRLRERLT